MTSLASSVTNMILAAPRPLTLYCETASHDMAMEYIQVKKLSGWHVLVLPFSTGVNTEECAFVLHRFFKNEEQHD